MKSKYLILSAKAFVIATAFYLLAFKLGTKIVEPGSIGVRFNNATGLHKEDLKPGWHWEIVGLQKIWALPSQYLFLNYTASEALSIRTKDNNTVTLDVSVPYRIIPGKGHEVTDAGNHLRSSQKSFRFERFANDTTISVLRETLARLQSQDFYNTDRRLAIAQEALTVLNEQLRPLHLEAANILIRAAYFRSEYETQLAQIQLNEQQKLLDGAKQTVAEEKQKLDNYTQQTAAQVAAKAQKWEQQTANLKRNYQVGFLVTTAEQSIGAARDSLQKLTKQEKTRLSAEGAVKLGIEVEDFSEAHLMGIKNIQAETIEYQQRVEAKADGQSARLVAIGEAEIAAVNGAYQKKLNALLGSPGGRAYVAYQAAENINFADSLTFQSADGIPAILRLHDFANSFMGTKRQ